MTIEQCNHRVFGLYFLHFIVRVFRWLWLAGFRVTSGRVSSRQCTRWPPAWPPLHLPWPALHWVRPVHYVQEGQWALWCLIWLDCHLKPNRKYSTLKTPPATAPYNLYNLTNSNYISSPISLTGFRNEPYSRWLENLEAKWLIESPQFPLQTQSNSWQPKHSKLRQWWFQPLRSFFYVPQFF